MRIDIGSFRTMLKLKLVSSHLLIAPTSSVGVLVSIVGQQRLDVELEAEKPELDTRHDAP